MKIKIVEGGKLGYPTRLHGKTVDAEKIGPDLYRLTARENNYLRITQRQIERGEAELVEDTFDYAAAYAKAMGSNPFGPYAPPAPTVVDDDDDLDVTGIYVSGRYRK